MFAGYAHVFKSGIFRSTWLGGADLCSTWLGGELGGLGPMAPPELGGMVAAAP